MNAMKKIIITVAAALFAAAAPVFAAAEAPIDAEKLPQPVKEFVAKYFPGDKIAFAKVDRGILDSEYDVLLSSGAKMELYGSGEWKEVECKYSAVPDAIVPPQILKTVAERYPDTRILQIDRDRKDYEVKLSNGLELTFDMQFRLVDIDD